LDSERYRVWQEATRALERLGDSAISGLRAALAGRPSLEFRLRVERILARLEKAWKGRRTDWAVKLLERIRSAEARRLLQALSRGAPDAWRTWEARAALDRLAHSPTPRQQ
jgi:hypothetical protein